MLIYKNILKLNPGQLFLTSRQNYASKKKSNVVKLKLKTDKEHQQENEQIKISEEEALRKQILEEYESQKFEKINRYTKMLPYLNVNTKFVAQHLVEYPLLSQDDIPKLTNDSKHATDTNFYMKKERDALNMSLLTSKPDMTNSKVYLNVPSITNIISIAQPLPRGLLDWKFEKIKVLGKDGFYKYQLGLFRTGKGLHKFVADRLNAKKKGNEMPDVSEFEDLIDVSLLAKLNETLDRMNKILLVEANVTHENLFYFGRMDCLAYYEDELYLIDWKFNESRKETIKDLYDSPMQISAYLGAFLNDPRYEQLRKENKIKGGLMVNVSKTTGDVDLHFINYQLAEYYWYKWLVHLKKFWAILLRNNTDQT